MKSTTTHKVVAFAAATLSLAMLLGACGSGDKGSSSVTLSKEPAAGVDTSYTGELPMPKQDKRYDNYQPRENVKDGGTYTAAISTIGPNWNAASAAGSTAEMNTLWGWYQPNLYYSENVDGSDMKPNPDFIKSVKKLSDDPLTVQYDLNEKAQWNDGTSIDYETFVATWKVFSGKDERYSVPTNEGYDCIESVTKGATAKQVIVKFNKPCATWSLLFSPLVHPKSAAQSDTFNKGWSDNPHNEWGAGPYQVESFTENQVVFTRNPKWWGKPGKLDKVIYKRMEDTAAVNAFQNGEIDAVNGIGSKDKIKSVRGVKDAQIRYGYSNGVNVINLNAKAKPLDDIKVRKAVVQAFDIDTFNKIRYQGMNWKTVKPGSELVSILQKGYENNLPADSGYSVEKAKKTLEGAGYTLGKDGYYQKDGKTLQVSYTFFGDDSQQTALANAFQAMLKKAGIKCKTVNKASAKFADVIMARDYQIVPMGWSAGSSLSFIGAATQIYGSDSPNNLHGTGSAEIDKLLQAPGKLYDYDKQIAAVNKAEKAILAEYGTIPFAVPPTYYAVKKGLANVGPSGYASVFAENVGWQK